jgi:acyl-CoA thioester hydrolase
MSSGGAQDGEASSTGQAGRTGQGSSGATAAVPRPPAVWSAPVRYAECDQQGIVFNSHYLLWCDEAVAVWFERTGASYAALHARGLDAKVVASALEWRGSARWGDSVDVDVRADRIGRTSFAVAFTVRVGDRTCCEVRTTYVLVDLEDRPTPVPDDLRAAWS